MRSKRLFRSSLLLALAFLVALFSLPLSPLAHASAPSYVKTITGTQSSITFTGLTKGDFLGVDVFSSSVSSFNAYTIFDSQANSYTELYNGHVISGAWWTI